MPRWKQRTYFGAFHNEQDVVDKFNLRPLKENERILFACMENAYQGAVIVLFEKNEKIYLVEALLTSSVTLHEQFIPRRVTWESLAQHRCLLDIKSYGARRKMLHLLFSNGIRGSHLTAAVSLLFPDQLKEATLLALEQLSL